MPEGIGRKGALEMRDSTLVRLLRSSRQIQDGHSLFLKFFYIEAVRKEHVAGIISESGNCLLRESPRIVERIVRFQFLLQRRALKRRRIAQCHSLASAIQISAKGHAREHDGIAITPEIADKERSQFFVRERIGRIDSENFSCESDSPLFAKALF